MASYSIGGIWRKEIEIEIEGIPPCLWCGIPVTDPSMDGPLVCGWCDCGNNRDGSPWTPEQYKVRAIHFRTKIEEYVALQAKRDNGQI